MTSLAFSKPSEMTNIKKCGCKLNILNYKTLSNLLMGIKLRDHVFFSVTVWAREFSFPLKFHMWCLVKNRSLCKYSGVISMLVYFSTVFRLNLLSCWVELDALCRGFQRLSQTGYSTVGHCKGWGKIHHLQCDTEWNAGFWHHQQKFIFISW